ncbi:MAG: NAD(P)H-dependent oxidoreductase [Chloroflexi bacterium]|nr:NAD(P)H-dependent oxidoreductase [Chloroflexota bacterium]
MKLAIISGSQRPDSQSAKVGRFIDATVACAFPGVTTFVHDLGTGPLPWCEDEKPRPPGEEDPVWAPISRELHTSDGIVVVSPEWGGMAPATLKNFFLWCNDHELTHKPGLIVAVGRRLGGSYPVAELRMSSYKNTGLCYIPDHIIVRHVESVFNGPEPATEDEALLRDRLCYALALLIEYAKALRAVRASGVVDTERYPWGM